MAKASYTALDDRVSLHERSLSLEWNLCTRQLHAECIQSYYPCALGAENTPDLWLLEQNGGYTMLISASSSRPIACLVTHKSISYTPTETVSPTNLKFMTLLPLVKS